MDVSAITPKQYLYVLPLFIQADPAFSLYNLAA
jgi:hypothetical protein